MLQFRGKEGAITGLTSEEGVVYIPSWNGTVTEQDISADKIRKLFLNVYAMGLYIKQKNLVFADEPTIEVYNDKNEVDEELQIEMTREFMKPGVDLFSAAIQMFADRFRYGMSIFNPIWEKKDGHVTITALRHLPSYTFGTLPSGRKLFSQVLKGVVLNNQNEMEFWQLQSATDATPKLLSTKDLFWVKDPADEELAGTPIILPLLPILEMMSYSWNTEMQLVGRIGSPIFFIRITPPIMPGNDSNGGVGDLDYVNLVLQHWGKDNAYPLRPNMEPIMPPIREGNINNEVIGLLHYTLIDYASPASFISKDGNLIGGSSYPEAELLQTYIRSIHRSIETACNMLLDKYLDVNGYKAKGYTAKFIIPTHTVDKSNLRMQQAVIGFNTQTMFPNEIRERLDLEGLSDEDLAKLEEYYKSKAPPAPPGGGQPFGMAGMERTFALLNALSAQPPSKEKVAAVTADDLTFALEKFADQTMDSLRG